MDGDRTFHLDRMHVDGAGNGVQGSEVLCCCREVHISRSLTVGQSAPMWKPSTGEPCAGEPHARFGGRGRREPSPTPIMGGVLGLVGAGLPAKSWVQH